MTTLGKNDLELSMHPQITQIIQKKSFSHEKAEKAQNEIKAQHSFSHSNAF